ncbi:MAG: hypothetical protein ACFN9G_00905 [Cardiobacterium sp.]
MKTFLLPLVFTCLLAACTSLPGSRADTDSGCQYRERDLTTNWYARSYWCIPDGRAPKPATRKSATP